MKKKRALRFFSVILVCMAFTLLAAALVGQQYYGEYEQKGKKVEILSDDVFEKVPPAVEADCLVLMNEKEANSAHAGEELEGLFRQLKVKADYVDLSQDELPEYTGYDKIVVALVEWDVLGEKAYELTDWVNAGGNLMVFFPPKGDTFFRSLSPQFGIRESGWEMYETSGIRMKTDLLLGGQDHDFMIEEPYESSLTLSVTEDCLVYAVSANEREVPILWEYKNGEGRVVFSNFGIMEKAYRGFYAAAYSLLGDAFAWPVINGSAFYLDDFPSPVPSGAGEYIERDYGLSIKDFYTNIWWPDLSFFSEKYGLLYSGMIIEDYNDVVEAPFEMNQNTQRFRYFGSELLKNDGEIGLHGYNHIPLCLKGFEQDLEKENMTGVYDRLFQYGYWNSREDMKASVQGLISFVEKLYPKEQPAVYVPPSNILSMEARRMLGEEFSQIKAIASIYFEGDVEYTQEFCVAEDGIVETPRIISGCVIDDFMEIAALSELNLHYVNSHFQHPDDVLDQDRGAEAGWEAMKGRLGEYLDWLYTSAPGIRNLTASEMAGAVQRYYYLDVKQEMTEDEIILELSNFQDEAQLLIRMNAWQPENPASCIRGGTLTELADGLYLIEASDSRVVITKKGV